MTDNHEPLRQAMSDLAEHGGNADLYERTLRRSRQTQRRTAVVAGAAAMVAVFAVGGAVVFVAAERPSPSTPVGTVPPTPGPTTPTVAPTTPSSTAPSRTKPASKAPSTTSTSKRPRYPECPSAKTLERLADMPDGWHFIPSSVECWKGWAWATAKGPHPGDGNHLFRYQPGTGWRFHSEGSAFECESLGIKEPAPFCG